MKKYKKFIFIGVLVVFNLYIVFFTNYKCPWRRDFNIYCAGCGGTRTLRSLMKLDFYQAFRYNNLIIILIPVFLIYYFEAICNKFKIKNLNISKYMKNKFWLSILIIIIFYGIIRNIPLFNYLLPTKV